MVKLSIKKIIAGSIFVFLLLNIHAQHFTTHAETMGSFTGYSSSANYGNLSAGGQSTSVSLSESSNQRNGAGFIYLIIHVESIQQVIDLLNGWNIFSLYVSPDDPAMMSIVDPLISEGSLVKIQNEMGAAMEYVDVLGFWIDNIGS